MEAADNYDPGVAQFPGEVVGLEDQVAGTLDRAKESKRLPPQNIQITKRKDAFRCLIAKETVEGTRIAVVGLINTNRHQHTCPVNPVPFEISDTVVLDMSNTTLSDINLRVSDHLSPSHISSTFIFSGKLTRVLDILIKVLDNPPNRRNSAFSIFWFEISWR
jgi:hypothetical protein